jgi:hypothetical protein
MLPELSIENIKQKMECNLTIEYILNIIKTGPVSLKKDVGIKVIKQCEGMFIVSFGLMMNPIEKRMISMCINSHFMTKEEFETIFTEALINHIPAFTERNMIAEKTQEELILDEIDNSNLSEEIKEKVLSLFKK